MNKLNLFSSIIGVDDALWRQEGDGVKRLLFKKKMYITHHSDEFHGEGGVQIN